MKLDVFRSMRWCLLLLALALGAAEAPAQKRGMVDVAWIGGYCSDVRIVGDLAYVAEGYNLTVLNIANREKPVRVGGVMLDFPVRHVAVSGTRAYAAGDQYVQVVDVADPATPLPQGRIPQGDGVSNVAAHGKMLYVAAGGGQLRIFDTGNPYAPAPVTPVSIRGRGVRLALSGSMLYALAVEGTTVTLHALDVSNPAKPVRKGSLPLRTKTANIPQMAVSGEKVVVTTSAFAPYTGVSRIHFIDSRNPARLVARRSVDIADPIYAVGIEGNLASIAKSGGSSSIVLTLYDWASLAAPREVGHSAPITDTEIYSGNTAISMAGGYAYAALGPKMPIVDVRTPAAPRIASYYTLPNNVKDIDVKNGLAYVADRDSGLKIMDVSQPDAPAIKGVYPTKTAYGVAAENGRALLAAHTQLHVLDVKDPAKPKLLGLYPAKPITNAGAMGIADVAIRGNLAYLATGQGGLEVVDLTNPAKPVKIGGLSMDNTDKVVLANNNYLLVHSNGIVLVDVSNPRAPVRKSSIPFLSYDFKVAGNLVFVALYMEVLIIDISNPANPRAVGLVPLDRGNDQSYVGVEGNMLAVAIQPLSGSRELHIYDVSNPASPVLVDAYSTWDINPSGVDVIDGRVYLGQYGGFRVFRNAPIHIYSPGGPASFKGGDTVRVHWKSDLLYAGTSMRMELWNAKGRVSTLGSDWSQTGESGKLVKLPLVPEGSDYRLRLISTANGKAWGESERPFTIAGGTVRVRQPNGGEVWKAGTRQNIGWAINRQLAGGTVRIELWRAGKKVMLLGSGSDPDGEAVTSVLLPASVAAGTDYKIRVISSSKPNLWDESDGPITIRK